jgi:shikimate dehydrogenase
MELAASLYQAAFLAAGVAVSCETRRLSGPISGAIDQIRQDATVIGAAVTMPCTVSVASLLDGLGPEAKTIGAVNTVSHRAGALIGWNTDASAFRRALEEADFSARGKVVLILGAGGAARACAEALHATAEKLWVSARDLDEARTLCRDLEITEGGPAPLGSLSLLLKKADLIVNATPVGSDGTEAPFPVNWITPQQFVFDLLYHPALTPLIRGARERGARAINGLHMLLYQAMDAFEIWTGQRAPEPAMRTSLERAVLERLSS